MLHIEDLCVVRGQDHQAHRVYLPQLSLRPGEVVAVTAAVKARFWKPLV